MAKVVLSEANQERLDYLRQIRRSRVITAAEYSREKRKIYAKQEREDEAERMRQDSLRIEREYQAKLKKREEKMIQERRKKNFIAGGTVPEKISEFLRNVYKQLPKPDKKNKKADIIRIEFRKSDEDKPRTVIQHRPATVNAFIKLFLDYKDGELQEFLDEGGLLEIFRPYKVSAQDKIVGLKPQKFRDGDISHCVFAPLLNRLAQRLKNAESPSTKCRLTKRINAIRKLADTYDEGVPEEKMEEVAKAAGYTIIIKDPLGRKDLFTFNSKAKQGTLTFTNTRKNHLDIGHLTLDCDANYVSQEGLIEFWNRLDKEKEFYVFDGDVRNRVPRKIATTKGVWKVRDDNADLFHEFNEKIGLYKYGFNALKYPEVNEFITSGRIINSWACKLSDEKPTGHLDMPKAYSQFKKCIRYAGFLGVIHQWRSGPFDKAWLEKHIGIYQAKILTDTELFRKLGLCAGMTVILPSVELLYFMDNGVEMEITAGVWGSRMDFEFDDEMLEDRRYCNWSGRLGMEYSHTNHTFKCDTEWAVYLEQQYGDDFHYWEDQKLATVRQAKTKLTTYHHILAFITAYTRISMMEAMKKFDVKNLVRVIMDGLYYVGDEPEGFDGWNKRKEIKDHKFQMEWYFDDETKVDWTGCCFEDNTTLSGQGGCGKTWWVLKNEAVRNGLNSPLFVSPIHFLGSSANKEYDVAYTTIHKLIGQECRPYKDCLGYPPVLFIDEITQIPADWIEKVFKLYKDSLIILAGDIDAEGRWYQTRNGLPGDYAKIWKPTTKVVEIPGDRRSRDEELKQLKLTIRKRMRNAFCDDDEKMADMMKVWAYTHLKPIAWSEAVAMFKPGDKWIAGTHKTNEKLVAAGIRTGFYKKGCRAIFDDVPCPDGYVPRGSFTTHTIQGQTISEGKIFISVHDLFEYAMLYTAASRAVHFNQLVFVRKWEEN